MPAMNLFNKPLSPSQKPRHGHKYALFAVALFSMVSLSSCEALFGTYSGGQSKAEIKAARKLITLGDISNRPVKFRRIKVKNVSAQDTIDSYQTVLDNTEDLDFKFEASRRIADLSIIAVEDELIKQADLADLADEIIEKAQKSQVKALKAQQRAERIQLARQARQERALAIAAGTYTKKPKEAKDTKTKKEALSDNNTEAEETLPPEPTLSSKQKNEIAAIEKDILAIDESNQKSYKKAITLYEDLLKQQPNNNNTASAQQ